MKVKVINIRENFNPNDPPVEEQDKKVLDALLEGYEIVGMAAATENNIAFWKVFLRKK